MNKSSSKESKLYVASFYEVLSTTNYGYLDNIAWTI